jgi:uncharacterized protein (TIGR00266 family)
MKRCHELDVEIHGHDLQIVEVTLDPSETVVAEAGAMNYMESGIEFNTRMGDGSEPNQGMMGSLFSAGKRLLTGESLFTTHFTNHDSKPVKVAFGAPFPGSIIALDLAEYGEQVTCQKDAFLCAALGTKIDIAFNRKIGSGLFGGEGFILQKLSGDGIACLHAGGVVIKKELRGETLRVDTGCLVAFTQGIDYDIKLAGGLKTMMFGGEGIALATLSGHGTLWLQSLPFSRLANRVFSAASSHGGRDQGEGSVLGGLGRLLDGR